MTSIPSTLRAQPGRAALWPILLGLLGVLVFVIISNAVIYDHRVLDWDAQIARAVHDMDQTTLVRVFHRITLLGGPVLYLVGFAVGVTLIGRRQWLHLAVWVLAVGAGKLLNMMLKLYFERPRPIATEYFFPDQYGYPSGHAMMSLIAYGMLAAFALQVVRRPLTRLLIIDLAGLLVLLVAVSRVVINVHFLSDVIGGLVAGGLWLAMCAMVLRAVTGPGDPSGKES